MIRMCILSSEPIIDERLANPYQYRASILNRLDIHFPFIPDIICIELMFTEIFPSFLSFPSLSLFVLLPLVSPFFIPLFFEKFVTTLHPGEIFRPDAKFNRITD